MKLPLRSSLYIASFAMSALPLHAAVTFATGFSGTVSEVNSTTELTYQSDASNSDLINGITPTALSGWNTTNGASPVKLTDGTHGGTGTSPVAGAWTTVGATATYNLGSGANGLGFDLSSIQSIAAWSGGGLGQQHWTMQVRPIGGGFTDFVTVNYQPLSDGNTATTADRVGGATKVTLSNLNVSGIDAIRVTANAVDSNNNFIWRELDVTGTSTIPEPSTAVLIGLGSLALLRRRRRD